MYFGKDFSQTAYCCRKDHPLERQMRCEAFGNVESGCSLQGDNLCQCGEEICQDEDEVLACLRFWQRAQGIYEDRLERFYCEEQIHRLLPKNQTETV